MHLPVHGEERPLPGSRGSPPIQTLRDGSVTHCSACSRGHAGGDVAHVPHVTRSRPSPPFETAPLRIGSCPGVKPTAPRRPRHRSRLTPPETALTGRTSLLPCTDDHRCTKRCPGTTPGQGRGPPRGGRHRTTCQEDPRRMTTAERVPGTPARALPQAPAGLVTPTPGPAGPRVRPLSQAMLHSHDARVAVPTYDRGALTPAVVHLSVGGFS